MGMSLAPFLFTHPPHAFMEIILIGLTFTVSMLTLKLYPLINKTLLGILIMAFLLLYVINFFVTPTFTGRLIYISSVFLLIPLYMVFRRSASFGLRNTRIVKALLVVLAIHLVAGWGMVVVGRYTLGKSVILSGYGFLIIGIIMRIAIYTFLDYVKIIAYFLNRNLRTYRIDADFIIGKAKPLLIVASLVFIMLAYLYNMNLIALVSSVANDFFFTTRTLGITTFSWFSVLVFFVSVYIAFLLAGILRHGFDLSHGHDYSSRSNLGSYLMLLRLLVITAGFIIGILASGFPMSNSLSCLGPWESG